MRLRSIGSALALAYIGRLASAQESYDHWTIEAMAAQARIVFRGTITDLSRIEFDPKPGQPLKVRNMLTLGVAERFKGSPDRWMTLDRETVASDGRYELWLKNKTALLWFTFSEEDPRPFPGSVIGPGLKLPAGQSWTAIHLSPPDPAEFAADPRASKCTFSMDFSVLNTDAEKLEATRKFLKNNPGATKVCRISIPVLLTNSIGYTGPSEHLVLPVSPELEGIALRMINSPDTFLPNVHTAAEATWIRADGVKLLGNFNSEKNVTLVKSLLNDPGKGPSDSMESATKTYFWVRLASYNVLSDWGIKVSKPVL